MNMRLPALLAMLLAVTGMEAAASAPGDYYTRLRANDAPVGGRITLHAYFLDTLDTAVPVPGPGRVMALRFSEANGKGSFVVPGDLVLTNRDGITWQQGFLPLGDRRLAGFLPKDEERWALWWVPDTLSQGDPTALQLGYGFSETPFLPVPEGDRKKVLASLPWEEIDGARLDPSRGVGVLSVPPDPAAFDNPPRLAGGRPPEFPKSIRMYDFSGFVQVVAVIDAKGKVVDAYVIDTDAIHLLNVSALSAVMDWEFVPGTKSGHKVEGEIVVPVRFDR
jgi:TonB family protein